jgi:hypothetical protein
LIDAGLLPSFIAAVQASQPESDRFAVLRFERSRIVSVKARGFGNGWQDCKKPA